MSAQSPETEQKGSVDRGQILLIVLIILAIAASLIMLITDSSGALKLALLASLWAAIIGFFLVTWYRRQAEESRRELEYARDLYHAEMECAEAEMEAEQQRFAKEYAEKQRDAHAETLENIQDQLGKLRGQLEDIAGHTFEYEPATLRAEARRILELEKEADVPEPEEDAPSRAPSADAIAGRIGQQPSHPIRYPWAVGEPEDTGVNPREKEETPEPEPTSASSDETSVIHFDTGSFSAVSWDNQRRGSHERSPEPEEESAPRGRRRADEHRAGSFTVAELLARSAKNKNNGKK